jgi:hypothetical protein
MKKHNYVSLLICLLIISFNTYGVTPVEDTIIIDDIRNLQFNENTILTIDRRAIQTNKAAEQFGTGFLGRTMPGYKARINYNENGSPNGGDLSDINLLNSVVGPVTINEETSFQVLFVDIIVDADTVVEGVDDLSLLKAGDIVAASGVETESGSLRATRVELVPELALFWLITGNVANLTADGLDIGNQHILTSAAPILCHNETLADGVKVIVELQPKADYVTGDDLDALVIICYEEFEPPVDPPNNVFFNGDIEQVNADQTQIVVTGTTININAQTQIFSDTGNTTLEVGMNVSINGYEDAETGDVIAEFILINTNDPINPPPLPIVLIGQAFNVTANDFSIQGLVVQINNNTQYINGTVADLVDGVFIELIAVSDNPNQPDSLVASQITFLDQIPPGGGNDFIRVEGDISNLNAEHTQFNLANETIVLDDQTVIFGTTQGELADGLHVMVEGLRDDTTGNILAEVLFTPPTDPGPPQGHVCLSGIIQSVNADQTQFVLENGAIVNVTANTQFIEGTRADLIAGASLDIAGVLNPDNDEVEAEVIFFTPDAPPPQVFFLGFISSIADDGSQITVDDTLVNITADTHIIGGSFDNLAVGMEVQVEGLLNPTTGEVDAFSITIPLRSVSAAAPVLPADVTLSEAGANNGVVIIMGIEVHQNELTFDFTDVYTVGLTEEQTVMFFGYEDNAGVVWASSIFAAPAGPNPGTPNNPGGQAELFLNARVDSFAEGQLTVMGVNIGNLDGASYLDENYQTISAAEFFATLSNDDLVSISDAESYVRASNTLNAGVIINESAHGTPNRSSAQKAATNTISGSGIVTRVIEDRIFKNSF